MTLSLSKAQARKLVLNAQRLPPRQRAGSAIDATLDAIEHLGYIQIDTISVIQRAHHHTLWNRNPRYCPSHLDDLVARGRVFEYWSHAAAYLPMRDYRFSLLRKRAIAEGTLDHWGKRDKRLMRNILTRIAREGPLMARDFEHSGDKVGDWAQKPAKRALEYLFMQGDLMTAGRRGFQKVYDLTERVLPPDTDVSVPTEEEYARFLISSYLRANGLGQPAEMTYLLKGKKRVVKETLQLMLVAAELIEVRVGEHRYYALPSAGSLLDQPLSRSKAKILSPFDNLLIQRKRMQALFDFDYQLECYVPAAKRRYGYFCLPVLYNGALSGLIDCKINKVNATLEIKTLIMDSRIVGSESFAVALGKELMHFCAFNQCLGVTLPTCAPASLTSNLKAILR
ncbi:MAG: crosslink repair DNA glycosylase YcaQ family protein [Pseudomonadota bacterium]